MYVPEWVRAEDYPPYEPNLHEDFPIDSKFEPRIPRILHQASRDNYVPVTYSSNIRSLLEHNKDWEYRFWTEKTAKELIKKRHPSLLDTFVSYGNFKAKSEILRYVVLYELGGVFADFSVKCLRPLRKLTLKYACIFTTIPFEIVSIKQYIPYALYHDLIFCRAKHPFLKQIIENAPLFQVMIHELDSTGPYFLTSQFVEYNKQKYYHTSLHRGNKTRGTSPYFYSSRLPELHEDAVYVPNSKYFSFELQWLYDICLDFQYLTYTQIWGCIELKRRTNHVDNYSFTYSDVYLHFRRRKISTYFKFLLNTEIPQVVGERLKT